MKDMKNTNSTIGLRSRGANESAKWTHNLSTTSAHPLRRIAIFAAVLVMSMANIGVMWGKIVYYNDGGESGTPKIHFWGGATPTSPEWASDPEMVQICGNIYAYDIGDHTKVIFRYNNASEQTSDLDVPSDSKNYYNSSWGTLSSFTAGQTLYLKATNWTADNAKFEACFLGIGGQTWVSCSQVSGDFYSVTIPSGEWPYVIFCRMNPSGTAHSWSGRWNQTSDMTPDGVNNCVAITASGDNNQSWTRYAPTPALTGDFNNWSPVANPFNGSGIASVELDANEVYEIKAVSGTTWYGLDNTYVYGQENTYTLNNTGASIKLHTAAIGGTYKFTWDAGNSKLSIEYPDVPHPNAGYIYFLNDQSWDPVAVHVWGGTYGTTWGSNPAVSTYNWDGKEYAYVAMGDHSSVIFGQGIDDGHKTTDLAKTDHLGKFYKKSATAGWYDFTATLTLNDEDATTAVAPTSITVTYGASTNINTDVLTTTPEKTGYDFGGFYTETGGGGTQIIGTNEKIPSALAGYTSDGKWIKTGASVSATLHAKWTPITYTITYKDQGDVAFTGTQTSAPTSHTYGTATTLKIPTKSGYTFGGWYTASNCASGAVGTLTSASLGATDYTANITLYAKWYANDYSFSVTEYAATTDKYAINDVVNTSTGGSMKYTPVDDDENARLYYFKDQYYVRFAYKDGNYTDKSRVTVYLAKALKAGSIITANINNPGSSARGLKLQTSGGTDKATWTSTTDGDHIYVYVVTADDGLAGTNQFMLQYASGISNLVTLTVANSGSAATSTITLNRNGGSGDNQQVTVAPGSSTLSAAVTTPTKTGYYFAGWYSGSGGTGTMVIDPSGALVENTLYTGDDGVWAAGDVTLYAKWELRWSMKGTMLSQDWSADNLISNIGTNASSKDTGYVELSLPANTDYEFAIYDRGRSTWMKNSNTQVYYMAYGNSSAWGMNTGKTYNCGITTAGAGTYRFAWNITDSTMTVTYPTSYTVTFGYGTGGSAVTATVEDDASALAASGKYAAAGKDITFTQTPATGYTFKGWYDASSSGSAISSMASDNVYDDIAANISVYAQYTANVYSITYKDQGDVAFTGSHGDGYPTSHTYGSATDLVSPTKTGYTFGGWFTTSTCTGDAITSVGATAYTANFTLYAKWTANVYSITLDDNGGSADGSAVVRYDSIAVRPAALSHATHASLTLLGYYTHVIGGTKVLNADGSFAATNVAGYVTSGKWTKAADCTLYAHWGKVISPSSEILYRAKDGDATKYNDGYPKSADANETFELNWKARMAAVHQYAIPNFVSAKTITLVLPVKTANSNSLKVWNFPYEATTTTDASDLFENIEEAAGISILTNDGTAFGTALATAAASGGAWTLTFDASTIKPYSYDGTTAYVNLLISTATSNNSNRSDYYTGKAGNASTPYVQVEYFDEGNPAHEYWYRFTNAAAGVWNDGYPRTEEGYTNFEVQTYNRFFDVEQFVVTDFNIRNVYTLTLTVADSKSGTITLYDYPHAHHSDTTTAAKAAGYVTSITGVDLTSGSPAINGSKPYIDQQASSDGKWTFTIPADQLTPIYQDANKTVFSVLLTGVNSTSQVKYYSSTHTASIDRPTLALDHVRPLRIGNKSYENLRVAHTAATTDDVIYVCKDYSEVVSNDPVTPAVTITKAITIAGEEGTQYTITRTGARNVHMIEIQNSCTIQDLIITGTDAQKTAGKEPLEIKKSTTGDITVLFDNVTFSKFGYDETYHKGVVAVLDRSNVTFNDVTFSDCHIDGSKAVAGDIFVMGGSNGRNITVSGTFDAPEGVYLEKDKRVVNSSATYTNTVPLILASDYKHNYAAVTVLPEANATDFSISNAGWYTKWVNVNGGEIHAMHGTRLTFDKNGGDADGSAEARTDSTTLVNISHVTRTGYTLTGYFTADEDGDKVVKADGTLPDEEVEGYIDEDGKWVYGDDVDLTLYAQWTINSYTLTWDLAGGTVTTAGTGAAVDATGTPSSSVNYNASITAPVVTKTGYTFSAWSPSVASNMPAANTTYTATWTANTYTITYKDCGGGDFSGSQTSAPTTHTYGTATTLKTATKDGTTFLGWFDNVACTGTAISSLGATAYTDDITLYAKWTTTLYDSYFYQTYSYDNPSWGNLISNAGFPYYINIPEANKGWSKISGASSITTPHDFTALDGDHEYRYMKGMSGKSVYLTATADVKAVHFYGWGSNTDRKIRTTAKMVSGTGDDLTISDVTLSYGNDGVVRDYVVNISSATGYSSSNYYDYTFTFINGDSWIWGIYVEKYTNVPVTAVAVSTSDTTLITGETLALTYTLTPDNTTDKTVTWSSSKTDVATVSAAGVVTAVAAGSATITATANDGSGETATCAVKVETCASFHGTIYSIEPSTVKNYSGVEAGTKDEYTAYADIMRGGRVWMGNIGESTIAWHQLNFQETSSGSGIYQININNDDGYLILNLNCALRNGDTIVYEPGASDRDFALTATATRSTTYHTSSHKYVVTDGDGLDGKDSIYVWRGTAYQSTAKWIEVRRPTSYMLTYDANGGSGAPAAERFVTGVAQALSSTAPTRSNYTFGGWNTATTGDGTNYASGADYTIGGSAVTLYAKWTPNTYTITYYAEDGETVLEGIEPTTYTYNAGTVVLPTPDSTCHTFDGWYRDDCVKSKGGFDSDCKRVRIDNGSSGNYKYRGRWTLNSHTLTWNFNGGSTSAEEGDDYTAGGSVYCGDDLAYPDNGTMSKTGYTFSSWSTDADEMPDEDLMITASWTANSYTVTLDPDNGNSTSTISATYAAAMPSKLSDGETDVAAPTFSGYTFGGYYDDHAGAGTQYYTNEVASAQAWDKASTATLYAKWTQTVTLNMQGIGSNQSPTVLYKGTALSGYTTPTNLRSGALQGYYSAASGGTKVLNADGTFAASAVTDYITDGKWTKAGATTLYAQWAAVVGDTLNISNYVHHGGGMQLNGDTLDFSHSGSNHVDGYVEWKVDIKQQVYSVTTHAKFTAGHKWEVYLINASGSTVATLNSFASKYLANNKVPEEYSETEMWDLHSVSAGVYTIKVMNVMAWGEPKLLYVVMDPITVTYDANGGTCATVSAIYTGSALTLPTPTLSGYTFDGWYDGETKMGNAGGSYSPTASITLKAKWTPNNYTVTLDNQSATSAGTESISVTFDANTNLTGTPAITVPTRSGYTFGGYYTATAGGGTQIIAATGDVVASASDASYTYTDASKNWKYVGDITLYAKWTAQSYAVTLDPDNGNSTSSISATYAAAMPSTLSDGETDLAVPEFEGYTFGGYYDDHAGAGTQYYDGTPASARAWDKASTATLYAKWTQTVTLNMQGVGSNLSPTVLYKGTALSGYTAPTNIRSGALLGYYTAASSGTKVLDADGTFAASAVTDYITDGKWTKAGATTLYAQWDPIISLPDTLRISNYVAYGGGLQFSGDTLDYSHGDNNHRDGYAEWKVDVEKYVYNVTISGRYPNGHNWKLYLISGSDTISTCDFGSKDNKGLGTETKTWNLSGLTTAGVYTIRAKNIREWGSPRLVYVAMDPITVTYDANGGTCGTASAIYAGSALTLPTATKSGYVFEGWFNSDTLVGKAGASYSPKESITVTAKWGIITALPDTLTKANVGDYSSDMTWYGDDDEYFDFGPEDKANLGRWAKWEVDVVPCTYNVTIAGYYPNVHQWQLVLSNGSTVNDTLKLTSVSSTGERTESTTWTLSGLNKGVYTLEVKNIYEYSQPKLKSLVITPDLYTITYDKGEYGTGTIAAGKKIGCHDFTLSSSTFTRAGYEQDGWATSDGGSKTYNLGGTYSTDEAITLYPHWTCATPPDPTAFTAGTITNGGVTFTITDAADAASYDIYYSTSSTAPDGETEATTTSTGKTKEVTGLAAGTTYYAWVRAVCDGSHKSDWVALTGSTFFTNYSITMGTVTTRKHGDAATGGTITSDVSHAAEDDEVTLTATPESGYTFIAWKIVDGSSEDVTSDLLGADSTSSPKAFTMPAYSVTVKATFAQVHSITYKETDKTTTIDGLTPTSYIYGVGVAELPTPEKTGYTFDSWYSSWCVDHDHSGDFDDDCKKTSISTSDYGSATYYATWTPNPYTITLDNQSATSAGTESISVTYDANTNLTSAITVPTKTCYAFGGYYTETAGGGTQIIDADGNVNASVSGYTDASKNWIHADNVTLYAKWTQVNLALEKTAVAGYEDGNAAEVAGKVTDGTSAAWVTWSYQPAAKEYVYIDLGAFYQLNSIEVDWGADYSTDYILQACQNAPADSAYASKDYNWFTLAEVTDAAANSTKTTAVSGPARYVRLHSLSKSNDQCIRVKEIRVYGTGYATTYTTPTLTTAEVESYPAGYRTVQLHLVATDSHDEAIHTYRIIDESDNISIVTTDGDDLVTISGLSHNVRHTLTVEAMDPGALFSESENVAVLIWDPTTNLALGKTVVAGYEPGNAGEHSNKIVDGTNDAWTTYEQRPASEEWFYIDLGAYYELDSVQAVWGEVYSTDYLIQASQSAPATTADRADDTKWYPLAEEKSATASATKKTVVSGAARYLRVHSLARDGGFLRLHEFRVFGSGFATADENAPEITTATASYNNDGKAYLTLIATDEEDGSTNWFRVYNPKTETYSLQQTNGSDQIVITGLDDCTDYTFEVQAMDSAAQLSAVSEILVNVPVITGTNLALGKTTSAGISEGGDNGANAVDGNYSNQWSGNVNPGRVDSVNQWMKVDLGKNYDIDSIKITWGPEGGSWPQNYEIQVSYNGTDYWSIVHNTSKDENRANKYLDLGVKGRYVRVWANKSGVSYGMCITELEVYGQRYTEDHIYDFTGQVGSSTAWATAANWTKGVVPSTTDTVRILAPIEIPADNTIQVAKVIVATGGKIGSGNSLTVGGKLTVAAGGALVVKDSIKRCADAADFSTLVKTRPSDIVVKSSAEKGNGTLLFANTGDSATVELYCKASTEAIPWTWQYVGVPFTTADPQAAFWGGYMYYWPEDASGWESVTKSTTLSAFTGYSLSHTQAGHIFSMEGELAATTSKDIAVPAGADMVVGNSWTAPIQIKQLRDADFTNLLKNVYFYNVGNDSTGKAGEASSRYEAGTYVTVPIHTSPYTGDSVISALQGFFVTSNGSAGSLHLSYADHVRPVGGTSVINGQMHAPKRAEEQPAVLKIWASGSEYDDRVVLLEREDFSEGLDDGWDGDKWFGGQASPAIYAVREDGTKDAVSALPELDGTIIGFRAGEGNEYTLRFEYNGELINGDAALNGENGELYLLDTRTGESTLIVSGATYRFTADDKEAHERFLITRSNAPQTPTGVEPTSDSSLTGRAKKMLLEQKLYIYRNGVLYDAMGKRVESREWRDESGESRVESGEKGGAQ